MTKLVPIFKWMGGKRRMMPMYEPHLDIDPTKVTHFVDLFAGSLASSIWAYQRMPNAIIHMNEVNPFLVGLYTVIRDEPEEFITELYKHVDEFLATPVEKDLDKKGHRHLRVRYRWYRDNLKRLNDMWKQGWSTKYPAKFYALQYILQRLSFGGAWQTNKELSPTYATPSGSMIATGKSLYNGDDLREFSKFLSDQRVRLTCGDYKDFYIGPGDDKVIFADPPYMFTVQKYDAPFSVHRQKELCERMCEWDAQGNKVFMTNSFWDQWKVHLPNFKIITRSTLYTVGQKKLDSDELLIGNCLK